MIPLRKNVRFWLQKAPCEEQSMHPHQKIQPGKGACRAAGD